MHSKKKKKTVVFKSFDYQTTAFEIAQIPVQTSPASESEKISQPYAVNSAGATYVRAASSLSII